MPNPAKAPAGARGRRLLRAVMHTPPRDSRVDLALLVVRIALAWVFVYYGGAKLFGWFKGAGIHGTSVFMAQTAHLHPGGLFAVMAGLIEFGGAIALVLGGGSRLVGLGLAVDQVMAMVTVTWTNGMDSEKVPPGFEFNMVLVALALVIVLLGAGRFGLDALLARRVGSTGE
jgi:putative oxidoreductase